MALRLTSLALLAASSAAAFAEPFGRFGYGPAPVPAFTLSKEGFKTSFGAADMLKFPSPATSWKAVATTDLSQTVYLGEAEGAPQKLKVDLLAPGFSLYSKGNIKLKIGSTSGPILTWPEGSVEAGVPVPPTKWILLSFRDSQPPLLFVFDSPVSAKLDGKVGDWTFTTEEPYKGWIRVAAPIGLEPFPTNTAAQLGALAQRLMPNIQWWTQPTPVLKSLSVRDEGTALVATWQFDKPGAVVPEAVALAPIGAYPIKCGSKVRRLVADLQDGSPLDIVEEPQLTVRFPMRRVPTGRALQIGVPAVDSPTSVAAQDIGAVTELALVNMVSARSLAARSLAQQTLSTYLTEATYAEEPYTTQKLPFDADGKGLDLAAAHALLMQATTSGEKATSQPNSILTSVTWRRDWSTWRLWCPDAKVARRAGALAALAGALCPEPERRLDAAMLEAGLAAERGLAILKARKLRVGRPEPLLEVMDPLRRVIFTFSGKMPIHDLFTYSLLSDLRVFGARQVTATLAEGAVVLSFEAEQPGPISFTLVSSNPIKVEAGENVGQVQALEALGFLQIRAVATRPGTCRLKVGWPPYADAPPAGAPVPKYSEVER